MQSRHAAEKRLHHGKRGVYVSIICYVLLSCVKIGVGWTMDSQALIADGWNNASDVCVSVAILVGLMIAGRPADQDHRYGHFRAETAAALVAALLMAVVGFDVLRAPLHTLLADGEMAQPEPLSMFVAAGSALILYAVYRYNRLIAEKTKNLAVLAAAYDNRSDAFVSIGTVVGIGAAQLGWVWADPVVALIVALIILKTAWKVGADAIHSLMDGFEVDKLAEIEERIERIEGVREILDLRARYQGSVVYVDVTIGVDHHLTVVESHLLTERVEEKLVGYDNIERVYVHVEPAAQKQG